MLKQDKNFRLPKETKRLLACMPQQEATNYKKLIIQAMILGSIEPPKKKKGKQRVESDED